jgi:tryptophan synthase beta chain
MLHDTHRVSFTSATDKEALAAYQSLAKTEGIFPALESAHAVAEVIKRAPQMKPTQTVVVNISGRGDKDLFIVNRALNDQTFKQFLEEEIQRYV